MGYLPPIILSSKTKKTRKSHFTSHYNCICLSQFSYSPALNTVQMKFFQLSFIRLFIPIRKHMPLTFFSLLDPVVEFCLLPSFLLSEAIQQYL